MTTPTNTTLAALDPPSPEDGAIILETERLILRRVHPGDAANLHAIMGHKEVIRCLSSRWPDDFQLKDAEDVLAWWASNRAETDPCYPTSLFVCVKNLENPSEEPNVVGSIGLRPGATIEYRTWTLGYFFAPSSWGKGYAQEAVKALTRFALRNWPGLQRIEAKAYSWNTASTNVMSKAGFVYEGKRRCALERYGEVCDDVIYGLLRSDIEEDLAAK